MLETALDKEGLIYYDKKSKGYIDEKVLAEETRAKKVENDLELKKAPLESPTLTGIPTAPTASTDTNTTQIATTAFVQTAVSNLVDSAPETLNTLNELSSALGDDPNFATTIATQLGNKVDKVSGKGLSTNDYTTTEKTKLESIDTGAEVNQNAFSNVVVGSTTIAADAKTDSLTLAAGDNVTITPDENTNKITISSSHPDVSMSTDTTSVDSPNAGETFTTVDSVTRDDNGHITQINTKTVTLPTTPIVVDDALSSTSTNPVQNKVINEVLSDKAPTSHAGTETTYGGGTSLEYGHVKLSDNYTTSDGVADEGVGASSKAIFDAFSDIVSRLGSISETNSNYLKIGNYVIQWGFYENMHIYNGRVLTGEVDLPVPFLDTNYVSLGNAIFSITVTNKLINHIDNTVSIAQVSNTKLEPRVYNPNNSFSAENIANYPIGVRWFAIGRWR